MDDFEKSIAELAAMKARGELTADQFEEAKRLVSDKSSLETSPQKVAKGGAGRSASPPAKKKRGCRNFFFVIVGSFVAVIALAVVMQALETPEQRAQRELAREAAAKKQAEEDKATQAAEAAKKDEERRKGFQCLSGWDGSSRNFVDAVKKSLRDPGSFEHEETRIAPVDANGQHRVTMTFRAKNGFGGTNVGVASGVLSSATCSLLSWTMVKS